MTRDVTWRPVERSRNATRRNRTSHRMGERSRDTTRRTRRTTGSYAVGRRETPKRRKLFAPVLLLVSVNVAVIVYHGNPFADSQAQASPGMHTETQSTPEASATQPEAERDAVSTETAEPTASSAPVASSEAGAPLENFVEEVAEETAFDPFVGLRAQGPVQRVETVTLGSGQNAASALIAGGIASEQVGPAIASLTGHIDFRRLRPGDRFKVRLDGAGSLLSLEVMRGLLERARADLTDGSWLAKKVEVPIQTVNAEVSGEVSSSLWNAIVESGESPSLVNDLVEIFAWEIDFYTEVYEGDTFRLLVEKRFADGEFLGYGPVLAAEFVSAGHAHRAFMHETENGVAKYFDSEGQSMRKQLLKAPLKYGRVTSSFGRRRHPVLGYTRAHNGVDYGVPTGTPVWSVGDGRVVRAGWHGGFGKLVEVRHANGWMSQYAHLSKIHVKPGQRVDQKQTIGLVGSTGMSTGPHLHYGLKKSGSYVNPANQKFERGKSLTGELLNQFKQRVVQLERELDKIHVARGADAQEAVNDNQEG